MNNLNIIDWIILFIYFFSIIAGFSRGFVKEVVSLITLIAAFVIASMFANALANYIMSMDIIRNLIGQASTSTGLNAAQPASYLALGISFGLLFAATVMLGSFVGYFLNVAFSTGILGFGNRLLGGLFGLVRGVIMTLVIIFVVQLTPVSSQSWWMQSSFVRSYQPAVQWLGNLVSPSLNNLKSRLGQTLQDVNSQFQNLNSKYGNF